MYILFKWLVRVWGLVLKWYRLWIVVFDFFGIVLLMCWIFVSLLLLIMGKLSDIVCVCLGF